MLSGNDDNPVDAEQADRCAMALGPDAVVVNPDADRRAPCLGDSVAVHAEDGRAALRGIYPELALELIVVPKPAGGAVVALLQPDDRRTPVGLARGYGMLVPDQNVDEDLLSDWGV